MITNGFLFDLLAVIRVIRMCFLNNLRRESITLESRLGGRNFMGYGHVTRTRLRAETVNSPRFDKALRRADTGMVFCRKLKSDWLEVK
jgi:hypothetical protein